MPLERIKDPKDTGATKGRYELNDDIVCSCVYKPRKGKN